MKKILRNMESQCGSSWKRVYGFFLEEYDARAS
jgi:hypothetical protein